MADTVDVELRGDISADIASVLDACVMARKAHGISTNRMKIVEEVLHEWMQQKMTEARMVTNITREAKGSKAG